MTDLTQRPRTLQRLAWAWVACVALLGCEDPTAPSGVALPDVNADATIQADAASLDGADVAEVAGCPPALACCPETAATACADLATPCAKPICAARAAGPACALEPQPSCVVQPGTCWAFPKGTSLAENGWEVVDLYGESTASWLVSSGASPLGPDGHLYFSSPANGGVGYDTCVVTPEIAHGGKAIAISFARYKKSTAGTMGFRLLVAPPGTDWMQADIVMMEGSPAAEFLPASDVVLPLPGEVATYESVRLAFCVTGTLPSEESVLAIDDVCVKAPNP